jgi:hypothetical protein
MRPLIRVVEPAAHSIPGPLNSVVQGGRPASRCRLHHQQVVVPGRPEARRPITRDSDKESVFMSENEQTPPYPEGGAGIFDVDPDQSGISQDPDHEVTSDLDALPDDMEL